jgi:hypothetical protein
MPLAAILEVTSSDHRSHVPDYGTTFTWDTKAFGPIVG